MFGFCPSCENSLEISRRGGCLLISGSQVRALVRPPSSLREPPFPQSTPNRALLRGISGHLLPGLWSPQAFALFRDDFWRPVSASKDSVPNSRALSAKLDRTALAIPTFGPL